MSVITGSKEVFPQPTSYGKNDAGQFSIVPFESTDANKINILAAQFDALGYNYQVEHSFGKSKITVQLAFNPLAIEAPVDLWEYASMTAQKDILDATTPSGLTDKLTVKQKEAIRAVLRDRSGFQAASASDSNNLGNDYTLEASWITVFGVQDPTLNDDTKACAAVYAVIGDGIDSFEVDVPVIRHTQTCSVAYNMNLPMQNIGLILSQDRLLKEGSLPLGITNNLPIFTQDTTTKQYGWKKLFPNIQKIAFNKMQYIQEYQFGKWDTRVFGPQITQ